METIKCPKCGAEIASNAKFCQFCGTVISPQSPPPYTEPQTPPQSTYANSQQPPYTGQQPYTGSQGPYTNGGYQPGVPYSAGYQQKSKLAAGLLGIFLGGFGIHNFYLGYSNKALTQLLVSIIGGAITLGIASFAMWIWGLIEGIQILTGSINVDARGIPLGE